MELPLKNQSMVVCGKNKRLFKKISNMVRGNPDIHVFSYVKDMHRLMCAADVLISKPGGLTCSEALASQIPMILINPIPGQEERNVKFLLRHRVARIARNPDELNRHILDLLRNPQKLSMMRQQSGLIGKPHAAWEAAHLIFEQIQNSHFHERTGS